MNPGGPGASGVNRVRRGFSISDEVAARFDIVGFDPRGVGQSTPVSCGAAVDAFRSTDLGPDDAQESTALALAARAVAEECRSEEPTSELQSLMRISYAVLCLHNNTTTP